LNERWTSSPPIPEPGTPKRRRRAKWSERTPNLEPTVSSHFGHPTRDCIPRNPEPRTPNTQASGRVEWKASERRPNWMPKIAGYPINPKPCMIAVRVNPNRTKPSKSEKNRTNPDKTVNI
jgi:hypothetical protein